ncbi:Pre-rRNA-processing protein esf-2 [Smittium mucronatum]|uniref:18S rRNA factor 2 n=1 Tax=Smittium mucronatum TaxID=133383 RepID=A0A1R0H5W5_9FUNG|nr:Pre-rRNA-processing protein esf-2 [Smittium mucronatum]
MDSLKSFFEPSKYENSDAEYSDNISEKVSDDEMYQDFSKDRMYTSKKKPGHEDSEISSEDDSDNDDDKSTHNLELSDEDSLISGEAEKKAPKKRKNLEIDSESESEKPELKPLTKEEFLEFQKKEKKTGVIYMSRVPPFLKPNKVRRLLSKYGQIGRLFLAPEDPKMRMRRIKQGGSKRKGFTEGWIEFADKKVAKSVAQMLNNQPMAFERAEREYRLRNEMAQAKNEANEFINKVEKSKMIKGMEYKKSKKLASSDPSSTQDSSKSTSNTLTIKQLDVLSSKDSSLKNNTKLEDSVSSVLGKLL